MLSQEQIEFFKQERMKHVNALEIISIKAQQMAEQYRSQMAVEEQAIENYNQVLEENGVELNEPETTEEPQDDSVPTKEN